MINITLSELCNTLKEFRSKRVALTFHTIGDRDGVGSAVALSEYFETASVVTPDFITTNARRMLEYLGLSKRVEFNYPDDAEMIMVMDANNLFALGKREKMFEDFKGKLLFIDHHAPQEKLPKDAVVFNDESYNSTASIVYEALKNLNFGITKEIAILLLNGITADSADLQNSSPQTFKQISELLETSKLDFSFFSEYFHRGIPAKNKYRVINDLQEATAEIVSDFILVHGRATEHANIAADTAMQMNADATLFWAIGNTEASISARLRSPLDKELSMHLGVMMKEIGSMLGGNGGGHACAAGAYGPRKEAAEEAANRAVELIKDKLNSGSRRVQNR
ncbi:MAG: DHH family phosphoesterase [Candidatus Micrarchaeales archaeon]|jgi:nanoRNase/pAp phosphatase (c-di-AMP/oligoRNAs hydrolase)